MVNQFVNALYSLLEICARRNCRVVTIVHPQGTFVLTLIIFRIELVSYFISYTILINYLLVKTSFPLKVSLFSGVQFCSSTTD